MPDEAYLTKHKNNISHNSINKLDDDFVGYLHYKDWDGKVLFVLRIEKGKPVKKYDMLKSIKGKISIVNNSKINGDKVMVVDDGGEKCYFMTWSWYQDCFEISPELMYCDEPVIYNIQYIEIPCQPPGGGGGGGDPDPCLNAARFATANCEEEPPAESDPLDSILKDTCLNAAQMSALRTMFNSYLSGEGNSEWACLRKKQFDLMKNLGVKFGFCINNTQNATQTYNPSLNLFTFADDFSLSQSNIFDHEFFHAYQNKTRSGGTTIYAPIKNNTTGVITYPDGFINIEFETALYRDITNIGAQSAFYNVNAPISVITAYESWLDTITLNNTNYPTSFTDFGGEYFNFMTLFSQYSGYANKGNIISTMTPSTLLSLFSTTNCK